MVPAVVLVCIFILNLTVGMYWGFGVRHYWFFEVLHFWGGFFVAMFFANIFHSVSWVLMGVGAISILWETAEYFLASVPTLSRYMKSEFRLKSTALKWPDTVFDVILNFSGAFVFLYFFMR